MYKKKVKQEEVKAEVKPIETQSQVIKADAVVIVAPPEVKSVLFTISRQFPVGTTIKSPTGEKYIIEEKGNLKLIQYK